MEYPPEFEAIWKALPPRQGGNPKLLAYKAYRARLREGLNSDYLLGCAKQYAEAMKKEGKVGTCYILHASTFLGPNERYKEYEPRAPQVDIPGRSIPVRAGDNHDSDVPVVDARPFLREILSKLAERKKSPTASYERSK